MPLNFAASLVTASIWYPTILGVLVVISAIVLFIGSIYLLLGTNLGARLGFLVTFTSLMGFLMILSVLWLTTASPLESPKGRVASWSVIENVPDITKAKTVAVRDIAQKQNKASQTDASNVLAAVDAALDHQGGHAHRAGDAQRQPLRQVRRRHEVHGPRDLRRSVGAIRSSGRASSTTRRSTP